MMGFFAAAFAEVVLPSHGLFGGWSGEQLSTLSTVALVAVTTSAALAVASKKKVGARLTEVNPNLLYLLHHVDNTSPPH